MINNLNNIDDINGYFQYDYEKIQNYIENLSEQELINIWSKIESVSQSPNTKIIIKQLIAKEKGDLIFEKLKKFIVDRKKYEVLVFFDYMIEFHYYLNDEIIVNFIRASINDDMFKSRLFKYMNDAIIYRSELADEILRDDELIKWINSSSIKEVLCMPGSNFASLSEKCTSEELEELKRNLSEATYDDFVEKFLEYGKLGENIIKKLDAESILRIFCFNCCIGLNDNVMNIIPQFFLKYLSYEKALFLIDEINIDEIKKIEIINSVYNRNINSIAVSKNELIEKNINKLLNLEMPVSDEFKEILPDLLVLPYNENLFNRIKDVCLKIKCSEYLQIYLSQLIKFIAKEKKLEVENIEFNLDLDYNTDGMWCTSDKKITMYSWEDKFIEIMRPIDLFNMINTCFHEMRHVFQSQKMPEIISINSLMCNLETILNNNDRVRYKKEYHTICTELDARIYGFYEAYQFLQNVDKTELKKYLKSQFGEDFIKDRETVKSVEYFSSLITVFFNTISSENIIELRKQNKTLELITDENGRPYSPEEIETMMNSINSYSTNDIEFNVQDRDTKLFYAKYLHNLRYGIENGLISFNVDNKAIKKS